MEEKKQNIEQDIEIDLGEVFNTLKENKFKYGKVVAGCAAVALGFSFVQSPKYESTAVVRAKVMSVTGQVDSKQTNKDEMGSYLQIMQSRSVIEPIIAKVKSIPDESPMKVNKDVANFVKGYLKYNNPKGTDIIQVTATAKNPEEAQMIAQSVIDNSAVTLTSVNKSGRSAHLEFLDERKSIAAKEYSEAVRDLENFKKENRVFAPDSQLNSLIGQLNEVDKNITNTKVTLDIRTKQMEALDDGLTSAAFITSGGITGSVRSNLLDKQMNLQNKLLKYTEKHPSVQAARKELEDVQNKIRSEALAEIAASEIKLGVLYDKKANLEERILKMSEDKIKFGGLSHKISVARETHNKLEKNLEDVRIQEAMNSMDLWVIDKADLPLKTANKGKVFFIAIGSVLGAMLCLGHALWKVIRSN
ncbi:MAG: hypothetical protein IJE20_04135 [Phascolarctobacterium sp.]|nr:hypothetical protein [Phascolarctobacterium sp.]